MNIGQFKEITKDCSEDTEIKISCFTKDYIVDHPEEADYMHVTEILYNVSFMPDFNGKHPYLIKELNELIRENNIPDTHKLMIWDDDDFRGIEVKEVVVISDCVILV